MIARKWNGVGDYDALLVLSEDEMIMLADHYHVDWSFFTSGPRKNFDDKYFCFVNYSRKVLALLPFLSLVFGGMYDKAPYGEELAPMEAIDYHEYSLEVFSR